MQEIHKILYTNPILVLFLIVAVGYLVGKIRIGSFSLGIAAVLFAGLGISAYDPKLALPQFVYVLGLVLFVYTIGLASGPEFFSAFRKKGLRNNGFVLGILVLGGMSTILLATILNIKGDIAVGMYTGAFTNTPALASVLDSLKGTTPAPVIGYSLAYPLGVMCVLAVLAFFQKIWKIDYNKESALCCDKKELCTRTVHITREKPYRVDEVAAACGVDISISRISDGGVIRLASPSDMLEKGMQVIIVGNEKALEEASAWLGEVVSVGVEFGHEVFHTRQVFLSNRKIAGRKLGKLNIQQNHGVTVTRIRRGDVDFVAHENTVLELGDRVMIVGPNGMVKKAADYFGDSYRLSSEFDILTFAIGIGVGILVGLIPIPLPGGGVFHLGVAGGTLLVALLLGACGRTGRIVWQLPFSTNMALRELGLVLFLAGIGSQSGGALSKALSDPSSLVIIGAGAGLTILVSTVTLVVGYKIFKIPFAYLSGMLASVQTQPAVLGFVNEQAKGDDAPNIGYASVYPIAMITKIVLAQIILVVLH